MSKALSHPVKLRGHHLLCMLTYGGAGYTDAFIANFNDIIEGINRGADIEIVSGSDAICGILRQGGKISCEHAKTCRAERVKQRDAVALKDIARALRMPELKIGSIIPYTKNQATTLRRFFARKAIRRACTGCEWHERCSWRAENKFIGAKLFPPEVP